MPLVRPSAEDQRIGIIEPPLHLFCSPHCICGIYGVWIVFIVIAQSTYDLVIIRGIEL